MNCLFFLVKFGNRARRKILELLIHTTVYGVHSKFDEFLINPKVNRHACEKSWKRKLDSNVMCAGTKSQVLACRGDSGGALICVDKNGVHK